MASVAFSVYLSHKLVIHSVIQLCSSYSLPLTSVWALLLIEIAVYLAGVALFFAVARPFCVSGTVSQRETIDPTKRCREPWAARREANDAAGSSAAACGRESVCGRVVDYEILPVRVL